jgi:Uma2 family endonuclease
MPAVALKLPPMMTVAEFLDWPGDGTPTRYELVDGQLRAMAPASDAHGTILINVGAIIRAHLNSNRPGCRVVGRPGVQSRLRADWNFRIPDLGVTCTANERGAVLTPDPILLIELLSPSNAQDTWSNVPLYASLPSVLEIVVIHTAMIKADILRRRHDGTWPENTDVVAGPATTFSFSTIALDLVLGDLYAGTHLMNAV